MALEDDDGKDIYAPTRRALASAFARRPGKKDVVNPGAPPFRPPVPPPAAAALAAPLAATAAAPAVNLAVQPEAPAQQPAAPVATVTAPAVAPAQNLPIQSEAPIQQPPAPTPAPAPAPSAAIAQQRGPGAVAQFLKSAFPGSVAVGQGYADAVREAYKSGGLPAAAGQTVRDIPTAAVGLADDALRGVAKVLDPAANFLKTVVTGDPTPIGREPQQPAGRSPETGEPGQALAAPASSTAPAAAGKPGKAARPQAPERAAQQLADVPAPGTGYFVNNTTGRRVEFGPQARPAVPPPAPAGPRSAVDLLRSLGPTNRATAKAVLDANSTDQQYSGQQRINAAADRLAKQTDPEAILRDRANLLALQGKDPAARFSLSRIQTGVDELGAPIFETIPFNQQTGDFIYPKGGGKGDGKGGGKDGQQFVEDQIYRDEKGGFAVYRGGKFVEIN